MKKLLLLMMLFATLTGYSQRMTIEVAAGHENYWYQHVAAAKFGSGKFGFFNVSSLHAYYDKHKTDEIMSQSYLTFEISPAIVASLGTFYATGPGITPSLAMQIHKKYREVFVMIVPRVDLVKNGSYEAMVLAEFRPKLFDALHLYSRAQLMSNYTNANHNRSYQNFRLGVSSKRIQYGLALNVDEYGKEVRTHHNLGLFIRTQL